MLYVLHGERVFHVQLLTAKLSSTDRYRGHRVRLHTSFFKRRQPHSVVAMYLAPNVLTTSQLKETRTHAPHAEHTALPGRHTIAHLSTLAFHQDAGRAD